jgi:hypothetical protein
VLTFCGGSAGDHLALEGERVSPLAGLGQHAAARVERAGHVLRVRPAAAHQHGEIRVAPAQRLA